MPNRFRTEDADRLLLESGDSLLLQLETVAVATVIFKASAGEAAFRAPGPLLFTAPAKRKQFTAPPAGDFAATEDDDFKAPRN